MMSKHSFWESGKSDKSGTIRDSELYFLEEIDAKTWNSEAKKNERYE